MVVIGQRSGGSIMTRGHCTLHPAAPTSREINRCKHAEWWPVGQLMQTSRIARCATQRGTFGKGATKPVMRQKNSAI